jgi:hypothetical protein
LLEASGAQTCAGLAVVAFGRLAFDEQSQGPELCRRARRSGPGRPGSGPVLGECFGHAVRRSWARRS